MVAPVLRLDRASRAYPGPRGDVVALADVTLDVAPGETVAVLGPSGSGKSTLLALAGLMDVPTQGRVLHKGIDLVAASEDERALARLRGIGFVFQHFSLVPTLSAERNVALPLKAAGEVEPLRRARDLLTRVGVAHRADHLPRELSGGEQQMVAVARALANRPYVVLADEPTAELDADSARGVMDMLAGAVHEGAALVVVTHDERIVPQGARRLRLAHGRPA